MKKNIKTLHLELTSRCILACPACPRTEWANILKRPFPKQDLDYRLLDNFLDCEGAKDIETFLLCGDYGDPIYYPELLAFIKHFRKTKNFQICTNGSRQTEEFWKELASLLTDQDQIIFAIDALGDENQLYRKNSHWPSIMQGMKIIKQNSPARIRWQTIVFRFNQDKLDDIKKFAEDKGAEFFHITTHRYGDDKLIPVESFVRKENRYDVKFNTEKIEIIPKCANVEVIPTLGSDGIFYPCDWLRNPNTFYKSELWKQKDRWLNKLYIANTNLDEAMTIIDDWANYVRQNSLTDGPVDMLCKMKCRKGIS